MSACKHKPAIYVAAIELRRAGVVRTYDAVYRWTCPDCGQAQRTTRLADTVYALRHAYGWKIKTHAEAGNLAVYTLESVGDMPGDESAGPHPRRLVRDEAIAATSAETTHEPIGYHPYADKGLPIPVAAIPRTERLMCRRCGHTLTRNEIVGLNGQPLLGGYMSVRCPGKCAKELKRDNVLIYVPVGA